MPAGEVPPNVGRLMEQFRLGHKEAGEQLMELFYPELRRLAAARMKGERIDHTWQPTVLVNELYLELVKVKSLPPGSLDDAKEKAGFLALAAHMMKRLLIHHARPLYRNVEKVEFEDAADSATPNLEEIEGALAGLAAIDPRLRAVVEMKTFEGLTGDEIAERLGCAPRTVNRLWNFAKHWLEKEIAG